MAEVDFSNAKIEPASTWAGVTMVNPVAQANVALPATKFYNANGSDATGIVDFIALKNTTKQLAYLYSGSFTSSGNEFYLVTGYSAWRVYNITFNRYDTFAFKIRADLICQ